MKKFFGVLGGCLYPLILYVVIITAVQMAVVDWESMFTDNSGIFSLFSNDRGVVVLMDNVLLLSGIGALFSIFVMYAIMLVDKRRMGPLKPRFHGVEWLILVFGGIGFSIGLNILISVMSQALGVGDQGFNEVSELIYGSPLWVQIAVAAVLVPIVEEQIFRGIIQRRIAFAYGVAPALFLSSLFFGVFHGNFVQGIYAFLVGLYLAYVYLETENLLYCICIHMFANLSSVLLSRISFWEDAASFSALILFLAVFLFGVWIYSFFYLGKRQKKTKASPDQNGNPFNHIY